MSRNAGFVDQCVELDFQYPSEGIHRRWDAGEWTPCAALHRTACRTLGSVSVSGRSSVAVHCVCCAPTQHDACMPASSWHLPGLL
jgi:hypothetical protein